MKKILKYGALMLALLAARPVSAQKNLSVQYVNDSRDYHGVTVYWLNKELPHGLELSGFTDIDSEISERDLSKFYIEPRIVRTGFFKEGDDLVSKVLNGLLRR